MELKMEEFLLGNVVNAIVCQAMILIKDRNLQLIHAIPEQVKTLSLYGDQIKLQSVLSDLLVSIVEYASFPDGWVAINISPSLKQIQDGNGFVHIKFRMTHPGQGLPSALIDDMFGTNNDLTTEKGLALNFSHKVLKMMNGSVCYIREAKECYFLVDIEFKSQKSLKS